MHIAGAKKTTGLFFVLVVAVIFSVFFAPAKQTYADYDGGRLIDNNIFLDANSLNRSQIQDFLVGKKSGLSTRSFTLACWQSDQVRQWYVNAGASCDRAIPASDIIYYASQIYGINPKVIIATLQKEQSLITAQNPTDWQLSQAMGYGCPTTGSCNSGSNFSYQIDNGAWVLRYHYERANGNLNWWRTSSSWTCGTEKNFYKPNLYPGQDVRFYDGNGVHYRTHFIANAATSSFYCYTPHAYNNPQGLYGRAPYGTVGQYYSGSYNFVMSYELWFGSTVGAQDLVTDGQRIFYVSKGYKYHIPTMSDYYNYGYTDAEIPRISRVSSASINNIPSKSGMSYPSVVLASEGHGIFLISNGYRHYIPSMGVLYGYGFSDSDIMLVSDSSIYRFKSASNNVGEFIHDSSGFAYKVESGKRRGIYQPWVLNSYPSAKSSIGLSWATIGKIQIGVPLTKGKLGLVSGNSFYVAINEKWFSVKDRDVARCIGVEGVVTLYSNQTVAGTPQSSINSCFVSNESNSKFLLDGNRKYAIQDNNQIQYSNVLSSDGVDSMSTEPYINHRNIFATSNGIYHLQNGAVRHIMYMGYIQNIKGNTNVNVLSVDSLKSLNKAANIYPTGMLISGSNRGINVVIDDKVSYVSSMGQFNAYGFNIGKVANVGDQEINKQAGGAHLPNSKVVCEGKHYMVSGNKKFRVSDALLGNYGGSHSFNTINCALLAPLPEVNATRFITYPGSKNIYYVDGATRRHILSWQKFLELGGVDASNVITMHEYTFNTLQVGASI